MESQITPGIVRVPHSPDQIDRATKIGEEKRREGYSPEALVMVVDEVLDNPQVSRAIVLYLQNSAPDKKAEDKIGTPWWMSIGITAAFAALNVWGVLLLFSSVHADTSFWMVLLIVIGQALLLRLAK